MTKKTSRDAKLRLVDSTATAWYLELDFDQEDFNGPLGAPMTEEQLVLNRGKTAATSTRRLRTHRKRP